MTEQTIAHKQKQLTKQVAAFAQPETKNSLIQLLNTFIPFLAYGFLLISASMSPIFLR